MFNKTVRKIAIFGLSMLLISLLSVSCDKDDDTTSAKGKDINTATKVSVDRFSVTAGKLMVRTATNGLPVANAPINFDNQPFITTGFDRTGAIVKYYNFDVQSITPEDFMFFSRKMVRSFQSKTTLYLPYLEK
jgi:hypothetical protein